MLSDNSTVAGAQSVANTTGQMHAGPPQQLPRQPSERRKVKRHVKGGNLGGYGSDSGDEGAPSRKLLPLRKRKTSASAS